MAKEQICKICGCTDYSCPQCIEKTGQPCYWVEKNLCSACDVELKKAEAQLLGFKHAERGFDLENLIESMGLKRSEWDVLKKKYQLSYLTEIDKEIIDEYFEEKKQKQLEE